MPAPLYQAKAEFFRMLGHPLRIRVLELPQDGPKPVRDLIAEIDIEPSSRDASDDGQEPVMAYRSASKT